MSTFLSNNERVRLYPDLSRYIYIENVVCPCVRTHLIGRKLLLNADINDIKGIRRDNGGIHVPIVEEIPYNLQTRERER